MEHENLKYQIGINIAEMRKQRGLTQAELAERLNYSDKAVSKWERGESVPDVLTLVQLAQLFGVTVDSLLGDMVPEVKPAAPDADRKQAIYKGVIRLSSLLVWFVALMAYVILSSLDIPKSWIAFVYAVPANAIVLLVLCSAWRDYRKNAIYISVIAWGCLLSIYVSLLVFLGVNVWRLIFLGVLGQLAIILWFRMLRGKETKHG